MRNTAVYTRCVFFVEACDRFEEESRILYRATEETRAIEGTSIRDETMARDTAIAWFDSDYSTIGSGKANRASCV